MKQNRRKSRRRKTNKLSTTMVVSKDGNHNRKITNITLLDFEISCLQQDAPVVNKNDPLFKGPADDNVTEKKYISANISKSNRNQLTVPGIYRGDTSRTRKLTDNVERDNCTEHWDIGALIRQYINNDNHRRDTRTRMLFEGGVSLELPKCFTEHEREILVRKRQERRDAVHVYDAAQVKDLLCSYLRLKHLGYFS